MNSLNANTLTVEYVPRRAKWTTLCVVLLAGPLFGQSDLTAAGRRTEPYGAPTVAIQGFSDLVAKLAYRLWEGRGRPLGSPEVDWFAAEQAVSASLAASGLVTPCSDTTQSTAQQTIGTMRNGIAVSDD